MDESSQAGRLRETLGMRLTVRALIFMGGAAALSWEILWQLRASLALGASAQATALVLAVTMGGMALGSMAAGRMLERRSLDRPLVLYGWLECAIGLFGLLMLPGFAALEKMDFDTSQTSSLLIRLNLEEMEVVRPENLARLRTEGIDAYLVCRSAAGRDGLPQSASVRINSTHTGAILSGLSWQNGWGGQAGSIADRTMRKDLSEAASEIARELTARLGAASPGR